MGLDIQSVAGAGAAGIWQIMKSTAQSHGLEVNSEVDERYNVVKATVAACEYFKEAYAKFGDWITAAASYNAGQNGIARRLESQRQDTALELWMPEETMRYIFRLLAAKMLFEDPSAFGFDIGREDMYPYIPPRKIVTVSGQIPSLVDFAEEHGTTYKLLKEANLWLRSDKLTNKSGRTYSIAIP